MKIVVIGGSGLIGKKLIPLLRGRGHDAVSASPSSGVNTITGEGLAEALAGADVVVDVTNAPSWEDKAVLEFFEFLGAIAGPGTDTARVSDAPMQPLAADDVAAALADVTVGSPANGMLEVAGPESLSMAAFVGKALAASGDTRTVVADPQARYFGAALDDLGLKPRNPNPRISPTRFEEWVSRSAARA